MERRSIQTLSAALVNRIAAGEVIERPASVVKELVENAVDAGARNIAVEIEDGGRELIRVVDDGWGIPAEELALAFAEHATSKIRCDEDLFAIGTMGFRGEALASIGAVSQARILSRFGESEAAYEITNQGGVISAAQAAAGNVGTTVEVRNLFFNTPARRKFLKGSGTESGHVSEMVLRLALPHPGVSFKLISGGRKTLDLPASGEEGRWLAAWPDHFREQRLPVDVRDAEVKLRGVIGLPELAHPTGKYQFFYLNGRHIRDKFVQHALREAYRGLTEPGRYPAAVLMLSVPAGDVDVNVHPTKSEVRFRDSGRIHGLILSSVRERLLGSDLTPRAVASGGANEEQREGMRERLAAFFRGEYEGKGAAMSGTAGPTLELRGDEGPAPTIEWPGTTPATPEVDPVRIGGTALAGGARVPGMKTSGMAGPAERAVAWESPVQPPKTNDSAPTRSSAIQLHNSYLVTESEDGLVIIDQHALHERIMYEELLARVNRGALESQRLLIPDVIRTSQRQIALLEQIQPLLARLGIEVGVFGPESVAVQAFPSFLSRLEPGKFVSEMLERGEQELLDLHSEELLHGLLDMMACKAAVKAGDPLTGAEIEALLARRELVERSSNCPHGRPTTLRLSLRDLEKQFKRTGF